MVTSVGGGHFIALEIIKIPIKMGSIQMPINQNPFKLVVQAKFIFLLKKLFLLGSCYNRKYKSNPT